MAPPVKALFVWCGNPVVTVPNAGLIRRGLEREDLFTVVSEQFLTDTARYADVVFPATTQLEQLDMVPSWGHLYLGWNEPAIEPQGDVIYHLRTGIVRPGDGPHGLMIDGQGRFHRVQFTGLASLEEARDLCARLRAFKQDCFVPLP